MAKSSDVGAVNVPRKLTQFTINQIINAKACNPEYNELVVGWALARLAFLESLVQDVAKKVGPWERWTGLDGRAEIRCAWCGAFAAPGKPHRDNGCPYPRLLAAVADDREEK